MWVIDYENKEFYKLVVHITFPSLNKALVDITFYYKKWVLKKPAQSRATRTEWET